MTLRLYQLRAIAEARAAWRAGARAIAIVMPTGAGKTMTGGAFVSSAVAKGGRATWIAHRTELIDQAAHALQQQGLSVGTIQGDRSRDPSAPVQVATVQTLAARGERPPADVVVWDECHHCTAATFREVAAAYPNATHIGLTATPSRADGTALGNVFKALVAPIGIGELVRQRYLVPCDVVAPLRRQSELSMQPLEAIRKHGRGQGFVFCANVAQARKLAGEMALAGIPTGFVDGEQPERQRAEIIARFKAGELQYLTNVYVLTEGFDHPQARTCVLARGCGSQATFLQMVGRVLRSHPGKNDALLIDLCGVVHEHGLPDEDRVYSLDGDAIKTREAREPLRTCPECAAVFKPRPICKRCGYAFPPPPAPRVKIATVSHQTAATIAKSEATRAAWEGLVRQARRARFKPIWASLRFRETFGFWPPKTYPRFEQVT